MSKKVVILLVLLLTLVVAAAPANAQLGINFDRTTIGNLRQGSSVIYVFGARAGQDWVVEVTTTNFDPVVTVYDADEAYTDDDDGVQPASSFRNALLAFTTLTTGTYYIRVEDFSGTQGGRFQIRLTPTSPGLADATTENDYGFAVNDQCGPVAPNFAPGSRIALRNNYYPSRLRAAPGLGSNQLAYIPSPASNSSVDATNSVAVIGNTDCRDGYWWIEVSYRGRTGWVAAGRGNSIWWRTVAAAFQGAGQDLAVDGF